MNKDKVFQQDFDIITLTDKPRPLRHESALSQLANKTERVSPAIHEHNRNASTIENNSRHNERTRRSSLGTWGKIEKAGTRVDMTKLLFHGYDKEYQLLNSNYQYLPNSELNHLS